MAHIGDDIVAEAHPVFLKHKHVGRAAGPVEAFGTALFQKHALHDELRTVVALPAVALHDIADHEGHDFNHGNKPYTRAANNVGIDDGYHTLVF